MQKKGQITVIMIMIILLLMIFGVMYYLRTSVTERKGEFALAQQKLSQERIQPINDYITSCLDISTKTALDYLGKQGGYLYQSQGGPIPDFDQTLLGDQFMEYESFVLAYSVFPPEGSVADYYFSEPPKYPWQTFPEVYNFTDNTLIHSVEDPYLFGYFGRNKIPELQKPIRNSLEHQLEVFVINNTINCIDWEDFQTQNIRIDAGSPNLSVTIGKNDVYFFFEYPLNLTDVSTSANYNMKDFSVKYNLRLMDIFDFIDFVTDRDNTDLSFRITDHTIPNMRTQLLTDVYENDDVIIIRDDQSKILDKPFEFRFAVHNRNPALFLLNNSRDNGLIDSFVICGVRTPDSYIPPTITIKNHNLIITNPSACPDDLTADTLTLPLNASDPDDENITYSFSVYPTDTKVKNKEVEESTITYIENNYNWNQEPSMLDLTVYASDGILHDFQTIKFRTHLEPVVP